MSEGPHPATLWWRPGATAERPCTVTVRGYAYGCTDEGEASALVHDASREFPVPWSPECSAWVQDQLTRAHLAGATRMVLDVQYVAALAV